MTNNVYIARNYRSKFDAAGKAKMDCETILQQNGWKNIGFKQTWIANSLLGTLISALGVTWALLRLKPNSRICLQYPFNKFYRYCLWGARLKNCKVLTIVHDVRSLKGKYGHSDKEIALLKRSDQLIVHNAKMHGWFTEQGITNPTTSIEAFDFLHPKDAVAKRTPANPEMLRVVFAGFMGPFVYVLDELERGNYKFDLYGVGFKPEKVSNPQDTLLDYIGCFPSDQVIDNIDGDFGLVWYGDALDSCDGESGQYLKYNNPHKLSLYVLCDMPIIIWKHAAMASFVEKEGIGITLDSLHELKDVLATLDANAIATMKANIARVKVKMQSGQYLSEAIDRLS